MEIVRAEWADAASKAEWVWAEDLVSPVDVVTVGWKARDIEDEDYIVICASQTDEGALGDCIAIPRGMLIKMEVLHA